MAQIFFYFPKIQMFSMVISLPLKLSARSMTWAFNGLQGGVGVWTLALGAIIISEHVS